MIMMIIIKTIIAVLVITVTIIIGQCFFVSMFLYFNVSLFQCFNVSFNLFYVAKEGQLAKFKNNIHSRCLTVYQKTFV